MRIAVLCNSRLGIPAIQQLSATGQLAACAVPDRAHEENEEIAYLCRQSHIPLRTFSKAQVQQEMEQWIQTFSPDVVLVFTFPYIIPQKLLHLPLHGFINFHFGLLPAYRGADAIFWQLKNQESMGGISIHQMTTELDKGPVYAIQQVPIHAHDTYGSHSNALAFTCAGSVQGLLSLLQKNIQPVAQDEQRAHYHKRPALEDVLVDWARPATEIVALINACNPWNKGALCTLNGYPLKIISAQTGGHAVADIPAGTIVHVDARNGFVVTCGQNELITVDICYFDNEFSNAERLARAGLRPGPRFDSHKKNLAQ